jgi:hypothetical protein
MNGMALVMQRVMVHDTQRNVRNHGAGVLQMLPAMVRSKRIAGPHCHLLRE